MNKDENSTVDALLGMNLKNKCHTEWYAVSTDVVYCKFRFMQITLGGETYVAILHYFNIYILSC